MSNAGEKTSHFYSAALRILYKNRCPFINELVFLSLALALYRTVLHTHIRIAVR